MSQQVPVKRTAVSMRDYARAVIQAWQFIYNFIPQKKSVAVLWAQYMIETGGRACWNWNIGNKKHVEGDGHDWHELAGTWEGIDAKMAEYLIANGHARLDTNPDHIRAMPKGKVAVLFDPPHPATRFVAYGSLDEAMMTHLGFLARKYKAAWHEVEDGDPVAFAHTLKAGADGIEGTWDDYFTASAEAYAGGMYGHFVSFMDSDVFDDELSKTLASLRNPMVPDDTPTVPTLVDFPVIHKMPDTVAAMDSDTLPPSSEGDDETQV